MQQITQLGDVRPAREGYRCHKRSALRGEEGKGSDEAIPE
jgi:hypothetical protein